MDDISKRLEIYIKSKNLTAAQVSVKPSWTKSIKPMLNPMKVTRQRSAMDLMNWKNFLQSPLGREQRRLQLMLPLLQRIRT